MIKPINGSFIDWCRFVITSPDHVILDTETTALDGEVIELSIIDTIKGQQLYNSLLKPVGAISEQAMKTHHINEAMVSQAPTIAEEWSTILGVLEGKTIIAYGAEFDSGRIQHSAWLHRCFSKRLLIPRLTYQCAMVGYADFWSVPPRWKGANPPWQSLSQACYQQGIMLQPGLHRAMPDCQAVRSLLCKIAATGEDSPRHKDA